MGADFLVVPADDSTFAEVLGIDPVTVRGGTVETVDDDWLRALLDTGPVVELVQPAARTSAIVTDNAVQPLILQVTVEP